MIVRQIKKHQWEHIYRQITTYGRASPLSLQIDVDINCNGMDYILKVQPDRQRRIIALQALGVYPDGMGMGGKDYRLIEDNLLLSSLLEIILHQGAKKHSACSVK